MSPVATRLFSVFAFSAALAIGGAAQEKPATSTTNDPRVGLKAGFRDAGHAAKGLELVATMPKPGGFFDPKAPAGTASAPRTDRGRGGAPADAAAPGATSPASATAGTAPAAATPPDPATPPAATPPAGAAPGTAAAAGTSGAAPATPPPGGGLNFANSDMAFRRADMFLGSFNGFNTYDIETPKKPRLLATEAPESSLQSWLKQLEAH